jgi:hypothetical protein
MHTTECMQWRLAELYAVRVSRGGGSDAARHLAGLEAIAAPRHGGGLGVLDREHRRAARRRTNSEVDRAAVRRDGERQNHAALVVVRQRHRTVLGRLVECGRATCEEDGVLVEKRLEAQEKVVPVLRERQELLVGSVDVRAADLHDRRSVVVRYHETARCREQVSDLDAGGERRRQPTDRLLQLARKSVEL